jgi:hypothetical protein
MFGLLRAYGTDNGTDSESKPDGNGNDDIPSYGTQFDKRNLPKEPHSDNGDGSVARDSLDGNESGNDPDYMEPDDAERERLRQEFLMQARAVRINERKLARRGITHSGELRRILIASLTCRLMVELRACNWHSAQFRIY